MDSTNTGGPAFPSHGSMGEVVQEGMTMRDYFAAKAMQTLMIERDRRPMKMVVEFSYDWADAMLEARVK